MEPTAESIFGEHLAEHEGASTEEEKRSEEEAFMSLLAEHPAHARELKELRDAQARVAGVLPMTADEGPAPAPTPRPAERFETGSVLLERYRIVGLLGRGGMGEVYRADDLVLGQPVALKFLSQKLSLSEDLRERFLDEVRLARDVSHSSICRVFDVGEVDGQIFLTMEYVDGEDLASLLVRVGRLPTEKALEIARQLCAGLAAVHERGIIHRDLKPGNVMIDGRGEVKIADFGLAGVLEGADSDGGQMIGTPAYMAPEITEGKGPSVASDVYALGLILYEIFTGQRAFTGENFNDLLRAHREDAPKPPSSFVADLDPAVEEVLDRCLDKDPARRPASALAVSGALPGGDPLAEALARGETPSPEAVAAAGGTGALSSRVAYGALAFISIVFWALCWLIPQVRMSGSIPLDLHPEVLEVRAKELLDGPLEYTGIWKNWEWNKAHTASGFIWGSSYLDWMAAVTESDGEVKMPTGDLPAPYYFWVRASGIPIYSKIPLQFVTPTNPSLGHRSEAVIFLRPDGGLDRFLAFRGSYTEHSNGRDYEGDNWIAPEAQDPAEVNSAAFLEAMGFDPADMRPIKPTYWPRVPVDMRLAWEGQAPGREEGEESPPQVTVEAGFYEGAPAGLIVYDPDVPEIEAEPTGLESALIDLRDATTPIMVMVMLFVGAFLMLRNFRHRRGDRPRALRLAWFVVILTVLNWLLNTHFSMNVSEEFYRFTQASGYAMFWGGASWVLYLGLEPHIRKVWPHTLISWTRVLSGRWRDPMVGRDLLVGIAAGLSLTLVEPLSAFLFEALGGPSTARFIDGLESLNGLSSALGLVLGRIRFAITLVLVSFLLLSLLRSLVRSKAAAIVICLLIGGLGMPQAGTFGEPGIDIALGFVKMVIWLIVAVRFGVLAAIVMQAIHMLAMTFPMTTELSQWHAQPTLVLLSLVIGLSLHAVRSAQGGLTKRAP